MSRRTTDVAIFTAAAMAGLAAAFAFARGRHRVHRQDLFSARPTRRFAALGFLEREAGTGSLPLLRDYIAWEQVAMLRGRARRLVRAIERSAA